MLFSACSDDKFEEKNTPAQVGDEIVFGGVVGTGDESRTVYGNKVSTTDGSYTQIKWYEGDKVRIHCAQALAVNGNQYCDYDVNEYVAADGGNPYADQDEYDQTTLTPCDDEPYGLQWGSSEEHTFYAVYPSPDMLDGDAKDGFSFTGNTLTGYIPTTQNPSRYVEGTKNTDGQYTAYTIHPAMRYAYMVAKNAVNTTHSAVGLTFRPVVAAVEMTVVNNTYTINSEDSELEDISQIRISTTDGTAISGKFITTIEGETTNEDDTDFYSKAVSGEGKSYVTIDIKDPDGNPITLAKQGTLTFTVFIVPTNANGDVDLSKINVTVLSGASIKTCTLTGDTSVNGGVIINAKKKNFISHVNLKWNTNTQTSDWMSHIDGSTPLYKLSIPGAGGVCSHNLAEGYNEQTLDISNLWTRGVRCFEINIANNASTVVCNGQATSYTLNDAVTTIKSLLQANPREFAVMIIGFQPYENNSTGAFGRNSSSWQSSFTSYWNSYVNNWNVEGDGTDDNGNTIYCQPGIYSSTMTLDAARGKLFCFTRPTAIGGDQWWYSMASNPANVIPIVGWGPSPDQFYARGYVKSNRPYYLSSSNDFDVEDSTPTTGGTNFIFPSYETLDGTADYSLTSDISTTMISNFASWDESLSPHLQVALCDSTDKFMYRTVSNGVAGTSMESFVSSPRIYAQEWKRIAKEKVTSSSNGYWYCWPASINEKKNDIYNALMKATKATDSERQSTIYINSICGFYIDATNFANSLYPQPHRLAFGCETKGTSTGYIFYDIKYASSTTSSSYYYYVANTDAGSVGSNIENAYDYFGGTQGDIANAASDLNQYFYDLILTIGTKNIEGPLGIVLMDRVADATTKSTNKPGYYLPQLIVANNFRFCETITTSTSVTVPVIGSGDVNTAWSIKR